MNAVQIASLFGTFKEKIVDAAKHALPQGLKESYSFTVKDNNTGEEFNLDGAITKGSDTPTHQVNKVDWTGFAIFAASKVNGATLNSLMREYMKAGGKVDADIASASKTEAKAVVDEIKGLTACVRHGAVSVKPSAETKAVIEEDESEEKKAS